MQPPKQFYKEFDKLRHRFLWTEARLLRLGSQTKKGGLNLEFGIFQSGTFSLLRWLWFEWTEPDWLWNRMPLPLDESDIIS